MIEKLSNAEQNGAEGETPVNLRQIWQATSLERRSMVGLSKEKFPRRAAPVEHFHQGISFAIRTDATRS